MKNNNGKYLFGIVSAATFGLLPLFTKPILTSGEMEVPSIIFYRYLIGAVILGAYCFFNKIDLRINFKEIKQLLLLALLYSGTTYGLFESYHFMDSGVCTTINFLYPVGVCFIMSFFYKEKITKNIIFSLTLAIFGVALLSWSSSTFSWIGLGFILMSSLFYSIYIVIINTMEVKRLHTFALTFYVLLFGSIMFLGFTQLSNLGLQPINSTQTLLCLFGSIIFATLISNITLLISVKKIGSTITSILGSFEPLTAVFVGVIVFDEKLSVFNILGVIAVLYSVFIILNKNNKLSNLTHKLFTVKHSNNNN